jgi:hypothetical protein
MVLAEGCGAFRRQITMAESKLAAAIYWLGWLNLARTAGFLIVVAGLTTALVAEIVGRPFQRTVDTAREEEHLKYAGEVTRLDHETQLAKASVASLTARAREAELQLEKMRAPRLIDEDQRARLVKRLKTFAGVHFDLAIRPEPEPQAFAEQVAATLQAAGWIRQAKQNAGSLFIKIPGKPNAAIATGFFGLGAEIDTSRSAEWENILASLADGFTDEGFPMRGNVASDGTAPPDAIHLFIGSKP